MIRGDTVTLGILCVLGVALMLALTVY